MNGTTTTFAYIGDCLRDSLTVGANTTTFTWDVAAGLPQVLDDGSFRYIYGLGRIAEVGPGGTTHYYLADALGSVMALCESSGTVVNTYDYDVFGAVRSSSGTQPNAFTYTGEQADASTGLEYLRARYYDMEPGRFIGRDLFPASHMEPASFNRFAYVLNDPVNLADPSGEHCRFWHPHHCSLSTIVQYLDVVPIAEACIRLGLPPLAIGGCQVVETAIGVASAYAALQAVNSSGCSVAAKAAISALIIENLRADTDELYKFQQTFTAQSEVRELVLLELQNALLRTCQKYESPGFDVDIGLG